jgi:hypothetical protein
MRRILTVCVTVVATVKAILQSRLAGNKSVRRKASFRLQQECLNAAALHRQPTWALHGNHVFPVTRKAA